MIARTALSRIDMIAAAAAALVSTMLLAGVGTLFTCAGAPLQAHATAQLACADHPYVSEREACVRARLGALRHATIAQR